MAPPSPPTFGALLRQYRERAGMTQEALAERARLAARGISDLERGARRKPRQATLDLLVEALQLSDEECATFEAMARGHTQHPVATAARATPPNNLAAPATLLIGRAHEVQAVCAALRRSDCRLVTLTGPGGVGKTRVALQVASELLNDYADGVFFVALASINAPTLLVSTIARTLGLKDVGSVALLASLTEYLRARHVLLVLDNFEHVVEAAPQLSELLAACPRLDLLVTSRTAIHVSREHVIGVPPLLRPAFQQRPPLDVLLQNDAVRLFVERAQAVRPDFAVTHANILAVAEICDRLDGLPLAIELAAARSRVLPPDALLARLHSRLRLLTRGASDGPVRQQTLRATIDWSYNLLQPAEQQLFERLGIFIGGCTLEAVVAICAGAGELEVLDGLETLVEQSLIRQEHVEGEPRFTMLETIREYAVERLEEHGDVDTIRARYQSWVLALVERAEPKLRTAEQTFWFEQLDAEHDNIRAVLAWCQESASGAETALRLAGAMWRFWFVRGYVGECRRWLEIGLAHTAAPAVELRAKALFGAATLARYQGEYSRAATFAEEGLALAREAGDAWLICATLVILGTTYYEQDAGEYGLELLEDSLTQARTVGDQWLIAWALHTLGWRVKDRGDYRRAAQLLAEALQLARAVGDQWLIAWALHTLGWSEQYQSGYRQAAALLEESLAVRQRLGDKPGSAWALASMGKVAAAQGDYEGARALYERRLALNREMGNLSGIAGAFWCLGDVLFALGDLPEALKLHTEGLARSRELDDKRFIARSLRSLGDVLLAQQEYEQARTLHTTALTLSHELRDRGFIARSARSVADGQFMHGDYAGAAFNYLESLIVLNDLGNRQDLPGCIEGLARVAQARDLTVQAVQLWSAAAAFRAANHVPRLPVDGPRYEELLAAARVKLTEPAFEVAWADGASMTPSEISRERMTRALAGEERPAPPTSVVPGAKVTHQQ